MKKAEIKKLSADLLELKEEAFAEVFHYCIRTGTFVREVLGDELTLNLGRKLLDSNQIVMANWLLSERVPVDIFPEELSEVDVKMSDLRGEIFQIIDNFSPRNQHSPIINLMRIFRGEKFYTSDFLDILNYLENNEVSLPSFMKERSRALLEKASDPSFRWSEFVPDIY